LRYVGLTFNTLHQYFGKIAVPEGFKEFNEVIGPTCSPRNWQRNRGLRLSGTKNEISHKNRARSKGIRDKWVSAQFKGYK